MGQAGHLTVPGAEAEEAEDELGEEAVDAMRAIKQALDTQGILNPGKILRR